MTYHKTVRRGDRPGLPGLVLTRDIGESFRIGDDIVVTVVGVDDPSMRVKLHIAAPRDVPIVRDNAISTDRKDTDGKETQ